MENNIYKHTNPILTMTQVVELKEISSPTEKEIFKRAEDFNTNIIIKEWERII